MAVASQAASCRALSFYGDRFPEPCLLCHLRDHVSLPTIITMRRVAMNIAPIHSGNASIGNCKHVNSVRAVSESLSSSPNDPAEWVAWQFSCGVYSTKQSSQNIYTFCHLSDVQCPCQPHRIAIQMARNSLRVLCHWRWDLGVQCSGYLMAICLRQIAVLKAELSRSCNVIQYGHRLETG